MHLDAGTEAENFEQMEYKYKIPAGKTCKVVIDSGVTAAEGATTKRKASFQLTGLCEKTQAVLTVREKVVV